MTSQPSLARYSCECQNWTNLDSYWHRFRLSVVHVCRTSSMSFFLKDGNLSHVHHCSCRSRRRGGSLASLLILRIVSFAPQMRWQLLIGIKIVSDTGCPWLAFIRERSCQSHAAPGIISTICRATLQLEDRKILFVHGRNDGGHASFLAGWLDVLPFLPL